MKRLPISRLVAVLAAACMAMPLGATSQECEARVDSIRTMDPAQPGQRPEWATEGMPDVVWRLTDAASVADDGDVRACLLREAEVDARAAVEAAPDDVDDRFALAVVLGLRADREGGRTKVRAASQLHEELRTLLDLDPDHARARHLLGRLHAGVRRMDSFTRWIATNLLGGGELKQATWDEAERNLAFAEREVPEVLDHHYELARLYLDTDRPDLARVELEHTLALPVGSEMEGAVRREAEELLREMGDGGS